MPGDRVSFWLDDSTHDSRPWQAVDVQLTEMSNETEDQQGGILHSNSEEMPYGETQAPTD